MLLLPWLHVCSYIWGLICKITWTLFYQLDCDLLVRLRSVSWALICQLGCCLSAQLSAIFCQLSAAICQLSSTAMCYHPLSARLPLVNSAVNSAATCQLGCQQHPVSSHVLWHLSLLVCTLSTWQLACQLDCLFSAWHWFIVLPAIFEVGWLVVMCQLSHRMVAQEQIVCSVMILQLGCSLSPRLQCVSSAGLCQLGCHMSAQLNCNVSAQVHFVNSAASHLSAQLQYVSSVVLCQLGCDTSAQLNCNVSAQVHFVNSAASHLSAQLQYVSSVVLCQLGCDMSAQLNCNVSSPLPLVRSALCQLSWFMSILLRNVSSAVKQFVISGVSTLSAQFEFVGSAAVHRLTCSELVYYGAAFYHSCTQQRPRTTVWLMTMQPHLRQISQMTQKLIANRQTSQHVTQSTRWVRQTSRTTDSNKICLMADQECNMSVACHQLQCLGEPKSACNIWLRRLPSLPFFFLQESQGCTWQGWQGWFIEFHDDCGCLDHGFVHQWTYRIWEIWMVQHALL